MAIPDLKVPSFSVPDLKVPDLRVPDLHVAGAYNVYNHRRKSVQRQHIKDLGDIILGNPITGTLQLQHTLEDHGLREYKYTPIINRILGLGLLIKESTIDPLKKGDIATAAINNLESLGGSLDILANPVKSLMPWAGGGGPTDLAKSMGWAEGEYRKQYQWDTGNFLVDIIGETISDPTNWFTFGGKQLSSAASDVLEATTRHSVIDVIGETIEGTIKEQGMKVLSSAIDEAITKESDDIIAKILERLDDNRKYLEEQVKLLKRNKASRVEIKRLQDAITDYKNLLDIDAEKKIADLINNVRVSEGYRQYNILRKGAKLATSVDDVLTMVSLGLSPMFGTGRLILKYMVTPTFKALWKNYVLHQKEINLKKALNNTPADFRKVVHTIRRNNYKIRQATYDSFADILQRYNLTVEQLQDLYATIYKNAPRSVRMDKEAMTNLFKQKLADIMPELRTIIYKGKYYTDLRDIQNIKSGKYIKLVDLPKYNKEIQKIVEQVSTEQFDDLYDALWESIVVTSAAEETMYASFKKQIEQEIAMWFDITRPGTVDANRIGLNKLTYIERLEFIVSNYFEVNGVRYTLLELPQYLEALNNTDPTLYMKVAALLDYSGINLENYEKIANIIDAIQAYSSHTYADSKKVKQLTDELQKVLKSAKTGEFLELEKLEKQYKKMSRTFEGAKNVDLNYLDSSEFKMLMKEFVDVGVAYESIVDALGKYQYVTKIPEFVKELNELYEKYFVNVVDLESFDLAKGTYDPDIGTRSSYVYNVVNYRMSNLINEDGEYDRETLRQFIINVKELKEQVGMWVSDIKNDKVEFGIRDEQFILKLNDLLNKQVYKDTIVNILDLFEDSETSIYYMLLSKQGMFWMEHTKLVASMGTWSKEHKEWFEQIRDKDSAVRKRIDEVIQYLHNEGLTEEARAMERIIASIECYMLATNLLSSTLTNYKVSKQFNDYLNGLLYNVFKEFDGEDISRMYSKVDVVVNKFMKQLHRDWDIVRITTDLQDNNPPTVLQKLSQELSPEEMARYEELKTFSDALGAEEFMDELNDLELKMSGGIIKEYPDYGKFIDDLKANLKYAMTDYVMQLSRIAKDVHPDIPICWGANLFTESITKDMQLLGLQYQEVMRVLADESKAPELLKDASDFIIYTAADKIQLEFDEIKDIVPHILVGYNGIKGYDKLLEQVIHKFLSVEEGSLHSIIRESFNEIKEINMKLQNSKGKPIKIRTKNGVRTISNVSAYITKDRFDEFVRENLNVANAYEWSTTNGMLAVKKLESYDMVTLHRLGPDVIKLPVDIDDVRKSAEYGTFYTIFKTIYDDLKDYKYFKESSIDAYRRALIELYSDPNIYWGPKDPDMYFRTASDKDIYAWYTFTKLKNFNSTASIRFEEILYREGHLNPTSASKRKAQETLYKYGGTKYSFAERINYNEDPASMFVELEDINNKVITDDNVYDSIIENMPINKIHTVREFITKDLNKYYKSPETMTDNITNVVNYHKQDVEAFERTRVLDDLMNDKRKVGTVIKDKEHRAILASYGIRTDFRMNDRRVQRFMMEERCSALADNVARWNHNELRSYIDYNTDGILMYQGPANFHKKFTNKELKEAGLKITVVDDVNNIYVIRRTDNVVRPKCHTYEVPEYIFKEQQDAITEMFKSNRDYFYWDGMDVPDELFTGQMMDLDNYEILLESKNMQKAIGDIGVRKTYSNISNNGVNNFYKKKILRPNVAMIGHYDSINNIYAVGSDAFLERGTQVPIVSTSLYNSAFSGSVNAIKRVNTEHKYIHLFMNDDYSIKRMQRMFDKASDSEIAEFFERGNYTAAIMREDRKGRPIIYKIHISGRADLDKAIKAGAVCLPHEVYRNAVLAINEHAISSKILKFYKQFMVATFKSIWLTTPGFLMRNFLDTAIYKNAATSGGVFDLYENMKYFSKATQLWKQYNDIQAAMLADGFNKTLNKRIVRRYLRTLSPLEREQYMLVDMFATSSASGGLSDALEEMLRVHNMSDDISIEEMWLNFYDEKILYGDLSPIRWVNNINSQIEQSSRLGLFLKLIDEGEDITKAVRKVTETHFDYKLKEPGAQAMEEIFWFSTYPINNMMYFMNEGITKNPSMFKLYMDMLEQSYNDGEYTWDDVRNSNYLKYNLFAGNLRLKVNGQNIILKTGSSVMSFFTMLFSPFKEAGERLNPFLAVLLGMEDLDELNPFSSYAYKLEQIRSGQSLLPSVYIKMRPRTKYQRKYYSNNYYRRSSWNPKPRKVSSYHRNMAYMNYKFATDRYYFSRGKNIHRWLESTNSIEPNWYMNNYRHYRANGKYGRALRKLKMPKKFKLSVSK